MKFAILLFVFLFAYNAAAQLKAKMADDLFSRMEYAQCVEMYDELSTKFLKDKSKEETNWEYVRRAAICHYQLFQMTEACLYFRQLKTSNKLSKKDRELYIQALRYTEKYSESEALLLESQNLYTSNSYFKKNYEEISNFQQLFQDSAFYTVKDGGINTGKGEFAPNFSETGIVYASKSVNTKSIHPTYGWDDSYYINILESNYINDSTLNEGKLLKNNYLSKAHDGPVSYSSNNKTMIITKNTIKKIKGKDVIVLSLYFSELVNGEWSELKAFKYNNENHNVGHAVFAENDKAIYFVSDQPGGFGQTDLYVSRFVSGDWSEPVNLGPSINSTQKELFPFVSENKLYFASNGHFGLGGLDVFEIDLTVGTKVHNLGYPINTSHDDFGFISDTTGLKGYFSSNRFDNIDRIYKFKKRPIIIELTGIVYAVYKDKEGISNHPLIVFNETKGTSDTLFTNEFGQFTMRLNRNEAYRVSTSKEDFVLVSEALLNTQDINKDSTLFCELPLKPTTIQIRLRVIEAGNRKVIAYAKTTVTDYVLNSESILYTDEEGIVVVKVDRNKTYWAHASKKGFLDDNVAFNSANEYDKIIDLELKLPPIVKGDKFKLENIFYDLNKSSLRSESRLALDKLADFIIKNDLKIELSSHTDARGSDAYNLKLSQARAQSCVDYLLTKGVKKTQIIAKGYGETQLVNKCKNNVTCPEELHQDNRRTEVKIL